MSGWGREDVLVQRDGGIDADPKLGGGRRLAGEVDRTWSVDPGAKDLSDGCQLMVTADVGGKVLSQPVTPPCCSPLIDTLISGSR